MRKFVFFLATGLLTACGSGQNEAAQQACYRSAESALQRNTGSTFELDRARTAESIKTNADGTIEMRVVSYLRKGRRSPPTTGLRLQGAFFRGQGGAGRDFVHLSLGSRRRLTTSATIAHRVLRESVEAQMLD